MFSYEDYKEIIRIIQSTGNQAGYEEALTADKFVIMRHDVEFSVDRAFALSKLCTGKGGEQHGFYVDLLFPVDEQFL